MELPHSCLFEFADPNATQKFEYKPQRSHYREATFVTEPLVARIHNRLTVSQYPYTIRNGQKNEVVPWTARNVETSLHTPNVRQHLNTMAMWDNKDDELLHSFVNCAQACALPPRHKQAGPL
jgi:hypothetical protein